MRISIFNLLTIFTLLLLVFLLSSSLSYAGTYKHFGNEYTVGDKWWYYVETSDASGKTTLRELGRAKEAYYIGLTDSSEFGGPHAELAPNTRIIQRVLLANVLIKEIVFAVDQYVGSATEYGYNPELSTGGYRNTGNQEYNCDLDANLRCTITVSDDPSNPKATLGPFTLTSKYQTIFDSQEFLNLSTNEKVEVLCFIVDAADTTCGGQFNYLSLRDLFVSLYERNEFPYAGTDVSKWTDLADTGTDGVLAYNPTEITDKRIIYTSVAPFNLYMYDNIADACDRNFDDLPNFTEECTDKLKRLDGKAPSGSGSSGSSDSDSAGSSVGFGCTASTTGTPSLGITILAVVIAAFYFYRMRRYSINH